MADWTLIFVDNQWPAFEAKFFITNSAAGAP